MARVWRGRRSLDTPRPAGRRWARLRRSGSRATQVFAQVTRRHRDSSSLGAGTQVVYPRPDRSWRRIANRSAVGLVRPNLSRVTTIIRPPLRELPEVDLSEPLPAAPATIPLLPGEHTPVRRIQFLLANGCTVASLVLGMAAVFLAINGQVRVAAVVLIACVVFDGFDGALARKFGVASPFGAQMDSLADLSSFGVAAGVVMYQWLILEGANPAAAAPAAALLAVCAAIRLARFNVSPKSGRFFCGVPTTMAAAVLALNLLIGPTLPVNTEVWIVAATAIAMVTSFPYAKLVSVFRLPMWLWVVPAVTALVSIPAAFALVVGGYLVSGPLLWIYQRRRQPSLTG